VVDECQDAQIAAPSSPGGGRNRQLYGGKPTASGRRRCKPVIAEFNLPQEQLLEIIDGMEMDLQQSRYLDFKALSLYCYRVASVVGLLAAEIFGYQDRKTQKYAHDLGIAFQLTNIIRDVGEDARMRPHLPADRRTAALRSARRRHPQRAPQRQFPPP
jgi:phytoene synthase